MSKNFKKVKNERIESYIYDDIDTLSFEELCQLYNEAKDRGFSEFDLNSIMDSINEYLEEYEESLNELNKYKKILIDYDIKCDYIDRLIHRIGYIRNDDIILFDDEELEYYCYDGSDNLSLEQLFILREVINSRRLSFLDVCDELIMERLEENTNVKDLDRIRIVIYKYHLSCEYIDNIIRNIRLKRKKNLVNNTNLVSGILGSLIKGFVEGSSQSTNNDELFSWERDELKNGDYEPFNFEEEELEDDDYYNDDLD